MLHGKYLKHIFHHTMLIKVSRNECYIRSYGCQYRIIETQKFCSVGFGLRFFVLFQIKIMPIDDPRIAGIRE